MLGRPLGAIASALLAAACGGGGRDATSSGVCSSPAAANTYDAATSAGCEPWPDFRICEVTAYCCPCGRG